MSYVWLRRAIPESGHGFMGLRTAEIGTLQSFRSHALNKRRDASIDVNWNGWPDGILPRITSFGSGDEKFPMPLNYDSRLPVTYIRMLQEHGWWVTNAVKHSDTIELDLGEEAREISLPSGDLYQSGLASEGCARARSNRPAKLAQVHESFFMDFSWKPKPSLLSH